MFRNRTRLIDLLFRKESKRDLRVPRFLYTVKNRRIGKSLKEFDSFPLVDLKRLRYHLLEYRGNACMLKMFLLERFV